MNSLLSVIENNLKQVVVRKSLEKPSEIRNEKLNIRNLDESNLSIVGTVMAQTVALDYYSGRVNR